MFIKRRIYANFYFEWKGLKVNKLFGFGYNE